jgi:hypothetical protein
MITGIMARMQMRNMRHYRKEETSSAVEPILVGAAPGTKFSFTAEVADSQRGCVGDIILADGKTNGDDRYNPKRTG